MDCPPGNEDRHQISKFSRKNSFVGHSHPSVPPLAALGESGKFSWLFVKKKKKNVTPRFYLLRDPMTSLNSRKVELINQIKIRLHQGSEFLGKTKTKQKVERGGVFPELVSTRQRRFAIYCLSVLWGLYLVTGYFTS